MSPLILLNWPFLQRKKCQQSWREWNTCRARCSVLDDTSRLLPREIHQHYFRTFLHSFKNNFTAVRRYVEVANLEIGTNVGQLPRRPTLTNLPTGTTKFDLPGNETTA
jgi:hypothetical protein